MAPPQQGAPAGRRSGETTKESSRANIEPPPGPPPGYRHSQTVNNSMNPLPPTPGAAANPNFRQGNAPERQLETGGPGGDSGGRNSPQPSTSGERDAEAEKQFKDLLTKYKNVKRLYFDGKTQIEQLTIQVEQLQNAVANQRMSQSRTALDDNEYTTRMNRLNGAINNLSFNIRKDWKTLPPWIERYVSPEALKTGKQEMTAVGRAIVIRWIVEELFNKCFHPGLDLELSRSLKSIEMNIRKYSYTLNSQEEFDALTSKVVNWRMATLEGLQRVLQSPDSSDNRANFTTMAAGNLTAYLYQHLAEPAPAGVDGSVAMIVELAVGVAANLPLESRDVAIIYPLPEDTILPDIMEPEKAGLPPLPEPEEDEESDEDEEEEEAQKKPKAQNAFPPKDPTKVRFAGFVAVEVRGRQVLVKAPVWNLG